MNTTEIIIISVTLSCAILLAVVLGILLWLNTRYKKIVQEKSTKVNAIKELNEQFNFYCIEPKGCFIYRCKSKREFDKCNFYEKLCEKILEREVYFKTLIEKIEKNRNASKEYLKKYNAIQSTVTREEAKMWKVPYARFIKKEEAICEEIKMKAGTEYVLEFLLFYTSPKGLNTYRSQKSFCFDQWKSYYEQALQARKNKTEYQLQVQKERALMTDDLRYNVLRRDRFRCQICGTTAKDGAELEIDHIIPVSKGGKTVMDNLQTLCKRCNRGKSNKYDPD